MAIRLDVSFVRLACSLLVLIRLDLKHAKVILKTIVSNEKMYIEGYFGDSLNLKIQLIEIGLFSLLIV